MQGFSTIYTDGHSLDISAYDAERLKNAGLVVPHPGAGSDGIKACDWILAEDASWDTVYKLIGGAPLEHSC